MDIAAIFSTPDTSTFASEPAQQSGFGDLGGFINTLVSAVRKVKEQGAEAVESDKLPVQGQDDGLAEDIDAALAAVEYIQSLGIEDKQALERITFLVVQGGLDSEILAGLDEAELADLAQWTLEGAGGLFEAFNEAMLEAGEVAVAENAVPDFGLGQTAEALMLLEQIHNNVAATEADVRGLPQIITEMSGIDSDLSVTQIDNIASQVMDGLTDAAADAGIDVNQMSLREVVTQLPQDQIQEILNNALASEGAKQELPEIPESILRSLAIEIISVDNNNADAADQNISLLDSLDNNQALREALLEQVSSADVQELEQSVERSVLERAVEDLLGDEMVAQTELVEEVELDVDTSEIKLSADVKVDDVIADVETVLEQESVSETVKPVELSADSDKQSAQDIVEQKVDVESLKEEFAGDGEADQQDNNQATANVSKKNSSANNSASELDETSVREFAETIKDSLTGREYAAAEINEENIAALNDETISDNEPLPARTSESTMRYANMTENIERLEKLLNATSGNNLKNITLELTPEALGKITINVEYKDGQVHTVIKTENEQARDLLLSGSDQLKKNLEASGVKIETFDVNVDREGYEDSQQRNQESWNAAQQERNKRRRNSYDADEEQAVEIEDVSQVQDESLGVVDGSVNLIA